VEGLAPLSLPELLVVALSELDSLLDDGLEPCASLLLGGAEVELFGELSWSLLFSELTELLETFWELELLAGAELLSLSSFDELDLSLEPLELLEDGALEELLPPLPLLFSLEAGLPKAGSFSFGQWSFANPGALVSSGLVMFRTRYFSPVCGRNELIGTATNLSPTPRKPPTDRTAYEIFPDSGSKTRSFTLPSLSFCRF